MGKPWFSETVAWHSSRVRSGYDFSLMTEEQHRLIDSKWHNFFTADWDYGQTTLAFFCAGIGIMILLTVIGRIRGRGKPTKGTPNILDRVVAASRYASTRQFHVRRFHWYSPSLAVIAALCGMFTFLMALMLAARPYYWPNDAMGHSPPLATRSGWISLAIMPFMLIFGVKVNFIGILTGVSHERLQVFHRWTAVFMYITSLVHTFPFIVNAIRKGVIKTSWSSYPWFWNGVTALVPQTYLVGLSWGIFRNPYYEIFKKLHYVAAFIFMIALFVHVDFRLSSWDYFLATAILYLPSWFARVFRTHYNSGIGLSATVQSFPGDMIKLSIQAPQRLHWSPGQHVFVRVLGLGAHFFTSHPCTVASIPGDNNSLDLVFKVKKGTTKKLADIANGQTSRSIRVLVDGPYGGLSFSLNDFDVVYLFAGGSGASFTVPLLLSVARASAFASTDANTTRARIEFVLAVKDDDCVSWMTEDLVTLTKIIAPDHLSLKVHITGSSVERKSVESPDVKSSTEAPFLQLVGRPNFPSIIREASKSNAGKIAVVACGPESLLYDVRNAVSECQLAIADGCGTCKDLYLHTESFGW